MPVIAYGVIATLGVVTVFLVLRRARTRSSARHQAAVHGAMSAPENTTTPTPVKQALPPTFPPGLPPGVGPAHRPPQPRN